MDQTAPHPYRDGLPPAPPGPPEGEQHALLAGAGVPFLLGAVAGPVLPLTRPDASAGGTLASGQPRLEGDASHTVERALREGVAPPPRAGRADDFSWPPS